MIVSCVVVGLHFSLRYIAILIEIVEDLGVGKGLLHGFEIVGPGLDGLDFAECGFSGFGVVPEAGSGGFRLVGG